MKALWILLAACSALLLGCSPGPLEVSYSGSDEGWDAVRKAAGDWNEACGEELVRAVRGESDVPVTTEPGPTFPDGVTPQGVYGLTHTNKDAFGRVYPTWIKFVPDNGWAEYTMAHEMGHALGIEEHQDSGIMSVHHVDSDPKTGRLPAGLIGPEQCARVRR